jgi:hypothetical protein
MPDNSLLLIAAAAAIAFIVFSKGIANLIKAVMFGAAALILIMWLGDKSTWSLEGLVDYLLSLATRIADGVTPLLDSLIEGVLSLL